MGVIRLFKQPPKISPVKVSSVTNPNSTALYECPEPFEIRAGRFYSISIRYTSLFQLNLCPHFSIADKHRAAICGYAAYQQNLRATALFLCVTLPRHPDDRSISLSMQDTPNCPCHPRLSNGFRSTELDRQEYRPFYLLYQISKQTHGLRTAVRK